MTTKEKLVKVCDLLKELDICIAHQDEQGAFIIKPYDEWYIRWLMEAELEA